ncbi:hypothetical protein ACFO4E_06040 [Nocardiopsis mangrovi]|uniref:Uncharacterized protein n=1 Tax=Nocardiopsis mangrovi TaxID=1179818 RepID=A0ABV9DSP0_9ACTN
MVRRGDTPRWERRGDWFRLSMALVRTGLAVLRFALWWSRHDGPA